MVQEMGLQQQEMIQLRMAEERRKLEERMSKLKDRMGEMNGKIREELGGKWEAIKEQEVRNSIVAIEKKLERKEKEYYNKKSRFE